MLGKKKKKKSESSDMFLTETLLQTSNKIQRIFNYNSRFYKLYESWLYTKLSSSSGTVANRFT